jgi:hypothetical protein
VGDYFQNLAVTFLNFKNVLNEKEPCNLSMSFLSRVEYSMTELGMTLLPIVEMMYDWGKKRIEEIKRELEKSK